jgi:hypothetical protein
MPLTGTERTALISSVAMPAPGRKLADALDVLVDGGMRIAYSISAEVTNVITVTITATGLDGAPLANRVWLDILLISSTSTFAPNAADYTIAATTGQVLEKIADKEISVITNAAGVAVLTFSIATAATSFLATKLPGGEMVVSAAMTHV